MGNLDSTKRPAGGRAGSSDIDREADEIMADLNAMLASGQTSPDTDPTDDYARDAVAQAPVSSAVPDLIRLDQTPQATKPAGPLYPEVEAPESDAAGDAFEPPADPPTDEFAVSEQVQDLPLMAADVPQEQPPRRKRHTGLKVLLTLVILLGIAYVGGAVYFMDRFLPNTTVNGDDVSLMTTEEVAADNSDSIKDFKLTVTGDELDLTLDAANIDASYDGDAYAAGAKAYQNPWAWPLEISNEHDIKVESRLAYDDALLTKVTGEAIDKVNKDAKKPVDAKLEQDKESKHYRVKEEEKGTFIDKDAVLTLVRNAVNDRKDALEIGETELLQPKVTKDDTSLTSAADRINKALDATQEIVKGDKTVYKVEGKELQGWVSLGDDLSLQVDDEAITKWARGTLSEKLDTIGAHRTFDLPDGEEVSVSGGTYGWSINGEEVAGHIADNIAQGKQGKIELTFLVEGAKWNPGGNDWGDTYVEINLGAQHVRYFVDGKKKWEADCVSGGPHIDGKDRRTPEGVYTINGNIRSGDVELRGEIDPKTNKPSYISHVKYWMPFIDDSVALHDSSWRSEFGGEIYKSNGSHGCVNLPPDKAAELYDMVGEGTVVVCHG